MACRVGMSTDPEERIVYWKSNEGHTHGKTLASGLAYSEALKREASEAKKRGCAFHGGGGHKPGRVWSVYHVWGGTIG